MFCGLGGYCLFWFLEFAWIFGFDVGSPQHRLWCGCVGCGFGRVLGLVARFGFSGVIRFL